MTRSAAQWLSFEASIFRRPSGEVGLAPVQIHGLELACLDSRALTRENTFDLRFEEVQTRLSRLPRTDVEPDGFFVQTGEQVGRFWRLQGHLFDLNARLWRVDLSGQCPQGSFDAVLEVIGWPATELVFQLVPHGVTIGEGDFRRWAIANATESGRMPG